MKPLLNRDNCDNVVVASDLIILITLIWKIIPDDSALIIFVYDLHNVRRDMKSISHIEIKINQDHKLIEAKLDWTEVN